MRDADVGTVGDGVVGRVACGVAHWAGVYGVLPSLSTNGSRPDRRPRPVDRAADRSSRTACHPLEVVAIEVLRVSGTSRPNAVAGAIAALLRSEGQVEVQAIGPQAVNQAVKALAIARGYIAEDGLDLTTAPSFVTLELHDEERTALRFHVVALTLEPKDSSSVQES